MRPRRDTVYRWMLRIEARSERHDQKKQGKSYAETESRQGRAPGDKGRIKRGGRDESISGWPDGPREKVESATSGAGPGPARKERDVPAVERRTKRVTECEVHKEE